MVVLTGELCQVLYELLIIMKATEKLVMMTTTQAALATYDRAVAMWVRPWMVEVSKYSCNKFAIVLEDYNRLKSFTKAEGVL